MSSQKSAYLTARREQAQGIMVFDTELAKHATNVDLENVDYRNDALTMLCSVGSDRLKEVLWERVEKRLEELERRELEDVSKDEVNSFLELSWPVRIEVICFGHCYHG